MKKVTLYIKQKKFLYSLLRNSIYIPSDREVETIPIIILKNILSKKGIEYKSEYEIDDSDIMITDDISIAKTIRDKKIIFIPPIDFNVIDGFVLELQRLINSYDIQKQNALDYLEEHHPNLKLISPSLITHPNIIFDLPLILNYNLYDDKWGSIHYSARNLFSAITYKPYRIDYSIREIRKINRVKLFLELLDSDLDGKVKLTIHNLFLHNTDMYDLSKKYFEDNGVGEYFYRLTSLGDTNYSDDELSGGEYTHQVWPVGKLINHTLKSDIALYHESAPEEADDSTMDYLITEKTIDLLSIGKPFIYNSKVVGEFNERFGFIDYNKSFFRTIAKNPTDIVRSISEMDTLEYEMVISKLNKLAQKNLKKLEEYKSKNTFLETLISN